MNANNSTINNNINRVRFNKEGWAITVPINENYTVRANIQKDDPEYPDCYYFTLEISETERELFQIIGNDEAYRMKADKYSINREVTNYIMRIYNEGFFDAIAFRYTYAMKFLDLSMEMLDRANQIHKDGGQNV